MIRKKVLSSKKMIVKPKAICYDNVAFGIYGEIAQLARAIGSYPIGREFESHPRYQREFN